MANPTLQINSDVAVKAVHVEFKAVPEGTLTTKGQPSKVPFAGRISVQLANGEHYLGGVVAFLPDNGEAENAKRPASAPVVTTKARAARSGGGLGSLFG